MTWMLNAHASIHRAHTIFFFTFSPLFFFLALQFMAHGCLHGCEVPAFLDDLGRQRGQLDSLAEHPTHPQYVHGMQLVSVEDEDLL